MQPLGLNGDILVGGHRLHVQTTYSASNEKIISHIFDQGRIIEQREVSCADEPSPDTLPQKLKAVHFDMISEMELLFFIAEKIRRAKHAVSCIRLGQIFIEKNLLADALEILALAHELAPEDPEICLYRGIALLRQNELGAAEESLRKGLQLAPNYADLHHYLGVTHLEQNRLLEAMPEFETALTINPKFFWAKFHLAFALLQTLHASFEAQSHLPPPSIRSKRVQEHLAALLHLQSSLKDVSKIQSALDLMRMGEMTAAIEELQSMRREAQTDCSFGFENEFYLKFIYGGKARDEAFVEKYAERLRAAIQDSPEYADLHNHLGVAYLIQCRNLFLRALDEFRLALKINPNYKRAEKNLKISENDGKGFLILLRALLM
ncbi:tetratricopeptide repeat protein [candidate division KSB1 bacterium]|nr:tetratricopeptide repeat protein [candidate division KSB1 bacterium]